MKSMVRGTALPHLHGFHTYASKHKNWNLWPIPTGHSHLFAIRANIWQFLTVIWSARNSQQPLQLQAWAADNTGMLLPAEAVLAGRTAAGERGGHTAVIAITWQ